MKTNKFLKRLPVLVVLVVAFMLFVSKANADTYQWAGNGITPSNNKWSTTGNWYDLTTPTHHDYPGDGTTTDVVEITSTGGGTNPILDVSVTIASLKVDQNATLYNNGTNTLTTTGDVVLGPNNGDAAAIFDLRNGTQGVDLIVGGSISGYGSLELYGPGQTIQVGKDFTVGAFSPNDGDPDFGSTVEFTNSTAQSIDPTLTGGSAYEFDNLKIDNTGSGVTFVDGGVEDEIDGDLTGAGILHTGTTALWLIGNMSIGTFDVGSNHEQLVLIGDLGNTASSGNPISQQINPQTFYDVVNMNAGTTLNGSITILDNLDFEDGNIILNSYNLTIQSGANGTGNSSVTYTSDLTGGEYSPLVWIGSFTGTIDMTYDGSEGYIITDGSGSNGFTMDNTHAIVYPVGNTSSTYNPIQLTNYTTTNLVRVDNTITDQTNSAVTKDVVQATWQVTPTDGGDMIPEVQWGSGQELSDFSTKRGVSEVYLSSRQTLTSYWHVIGGSTNYGAASGTDPYDFTPPSSAKVTMTGTQLYYIAMGDLGSELPVSLLTFAAQYQDGHVNLDWTTASEQNNAYFEVERSTDASSWTPIGQVQGHGTTDQMNNYVDIDNLAGVVPTGTLYYRLKQVDFNGKFTYSMIRSVDLSNPGPSLAAYPNPTSNMLNVNWTSATDDNAVLRMVNMSGVNVYEQTVSGKGTIEQKIDMSMLPAGVYYLQIISNNNTVNLPVFKN